MAAGKWKVYSRTKLRALQAMLAFDASELRLALFRYPSNCIELNSLEFYTDLTDEHPEEFGYETGGQAVVPTLAEDNGVITFDISNALWLPVGGPIIARYGVVYSPATSGGLLIATCVLEFDEELNEVDVQRDSGDAFEVRINPGGALTLSGATVD